MTEHAESRLSITIQLAIRCRKTRLPESRGKTAIGRRRTKEMSFPESEDEALRKAAWTSNEKLVDSPTKH
eukprot:1304262-Rhodomonas_salina.2